MHETWIEQLGGTIEVSLYDTTVLGEGLMGFATLGNLRMRYGWEGKMEIGWIPEFDRWFNSVDWECDIPASKEALLDISKQAEAMGERGLLNGPDSNYQPTKIEPTCA